MATLQGVSYYLELTFSEEIKAHHILPSSEGDLSDFPATLPPLSPPSWESPAVKLVSPSRNRARARRVQH